MKIQNHKKFSESDTLSFYDEITTNTADHCAAACNEMASCQAFLFVKDGLQCKLTEQVLVPRDCAALYRCLKWGSLWLPLQCIIHYILIIDWLRLQYILQYILVSCLLPLTV